MISKTHLWKTVFYVGVLFAAAALMISCQTAHMGLEEETPADEIRYQLIYVIHGDGSYLFHTRDGTAYQADLRVLEQAFDTAATLTHGEVFIFHQKSRKNTRFFSSNDGRFYYYKKGERNRTYSYQRKHSPSIWDEEAALFQSHQTQSNPDPKSSEKPLRIFLFFGHQVFETNGLGYYSSYADETFSTYELAKGISLFDTQVKTSSSTVTGQEADKPFDLIVLSTCRGGTPGTIQTLSPLTRYIIASPENLHLSHMNMSLLGNLETWDGNNLQPFLMELVDLAFTELIQLTNTVVSIALYDTDKVSAYLESIEEEYENRLHALEEDGVVPLDFFDCQDDRAFSREHVGDGVFILYRPPLFGRNKSKSSHSGWECWR
jgi:hypothetical protein